MLITCRQKQNLCKKAGITIPMFLGILALTPLSAWAEEENMAFAGLGKVATYRQIGPDSLILNTQHEIDGRMGAFVFFSTVEGPAGMPQPTLSWPGSTAFFADHPGVAYVEFDMDDGVEWEFRWNTNDLTDFQTYFPSGVYEVSVGEKSASLQLTEDAFPESPPISVTADGDWRNGRYVILEGNGLNLSVTAPDWNDGAVRVMHFEMWGPNGRIFSEARINDPDFLDGFAPPFTTDPTFTINVPASELPWLLNGSYNVEFLYSIVEDVVTEEGIIGLSIVETMVRFDVVVARQWTYELWRDHVFSPEDAADPSRSGPYAEFLGDGIPNLMKFAINMAPWDSNRASLPYGRFEAGRLQMTFMKHRFADLQYVVEVSADMVNWHSGEPHTRIEEIAEKFLIFDRVTYSDQNPDGTENRFMRLRVEPTAPLP